MENTIFYLIGLPGVGKYTIAKALMARCGATLVDNHLINNPVLSVMNIPNGTPTPDKAWAQVKKIRLTVFEPVEKLCPPSMSFVFTNALRQSDPHALPLYTEVQNISLSRQAIFIPVRLFCDASVHEERISQPERRLRHKATIMTRKDQEVLNIDHLNLLDLDTTNLSAEDAAEAIINHANYFIK